MSEDRIDIEAIFNVARGKEHPEEQSAYLDEACRGRPEVRKRVEQLLKAEEAAGDFLNKPVTGPTVDKPSELEVPGTVIDRYKLLQQIGEGGFGVVYMAEQEEPIRRRVALKIIKLGMDTKQVIARFEAERQALAMMDHPNIAHVFDAGATDTGRPYFVMELVKGVPITEYCDSNNLSTYERLRLFIDVCKAVQHAHQKGIIHRDIKPSNVMITLHDGVPVPKVIDFGVAKATQQRLTEKTLFTEFRQFIGTPEYMSPEQAEMSGLDVDTRSDIYSLGVLLYELLTGTTPFDAKELRSAAFDEVLRIIRETEPPKPSTRLSTLGETLTDIARHRHVEPRQLCRIVRGDLDWIVMKTLEKDRTRRYETSHELAMEIQRHMNDEPVTAGPPDRVYRIKKFIRRNRTAVTSVLLIALALIIGLSLATVGFVRASLERDRAVVAEADALRQRDLAQEQRQRAEANFQMSFNAVEKMLGVAGLRVNMVDEEWQVDIEQSADTPKMQDVQQKLLQKAKVLYKWFYEAKQSYNLEHSETTSKGRLVGWWKLDETEGTKATDSSGNGFDAKVVGGGLWSGGKHGGSLCLDGIDNYAEIEPLNLYSNKVTISAWIRPNGKQNAYVGIVFSRDVSTIAGLCFGSTGPPAWSANNQLAYNWNDDQKTWNWHSGLVIPDDKWVFVALVVEPDKATLYLGENGELSRVVNRIGHYIEEFDGITRIGNDDDPRTGEQKHFKGLIDDVRIYSFALSEAEIATLATESNPEQANNGEALGLQGNE